MKRCRWVPPITALFLAVLASVATAQENVWMSRGPAGVGNVFDVAIGDGVAFAATPNGVFRSRDGGASWAQSGVAGEDVVSVRTRPGAAVVLALLFVRNSDVGGLYQSTDEGETWVRAPGLPSVTLSAIDPRNLSNLYAASADGSIWSSADAGSSWHRLSTTPTGKPALSMVFAGNAIYILSFEESDQGSYIYHFYRSTDGGASWTLFQTPSHEVSVFGGSTSPNVVYAGGPRVFCRSADSAATWTCSDFPASPLLIVGVPGDAERILAPSPGGVYVSHDQGATWALVEDELGSRADVVALVSDASGSLVLAGSGIGIFRSRDRGDSWTPASAGLRASDISALALDASDPSSVWASGSGLADAGLFRSADAGRSWSLAGGPGNPLFANALAIDPGNPSTLYAANSDVYRSEDGGAHWTHSTPINFGNVDALAVDPGSPARVWAAGGGGLFRSDDGARTWDPASISQEVYSLVFDDRRPGTVYAGSYYDIESGYYGYPEGGSIFVSVDAGATFTKNNENFSSAVTAIALDRSHDGALYLGTASTGVFHSTDNGATWEGPPAPPDIGRVSSLVADPVRPGRLYASTDLGVFRTVDGARTWHPFSAGLGSLGAGPLLISPDGGQLHVGTTGGGVFELDLATQPCAASSTRLCLADGRFAVDLYARRGAGSPYSPGTARPLSGGSGYFGLPFATGDAELPEVVLKVVGDGAIGQGASIYYSSLTTLPFVFTVTDTATGGVDVYSSADQPLCGGTSPSSTTAEPASTPRAADAPAAETLSLLGSRFLVTLAARNPGTGQVMTGHAVPQTDRFGYFSFPELTGDPLFPEVVVKMIDGRAVTGEFWFFHTGLTHVDYTLTVVDSVTGATRTYESPGPLCGAADTSAFPIDSGAGQWDY